MYLDYLIPALAAFAVSAITGPLIIPLLRMVKAGQTIREEGPKSHQVKTGTPTIGGVIFLLAFFMVSIVYTAKGLISKDCGFVMISVAGFGIIGFVDDFIKVVLKRNLGLWAWQKFLMQLLFGAGLIIYGVRAELLDTTVYLPFVSETVDMGPVYYVFTLLVLLGTVNGANFTDGLDGLASKVTAVIALFFILAAAANYSDTYVTSAAMLGGLLGFLIFNSHKASVFMGDTGSLALGGYVAATAMVLGMPVYIVIIAFVYFAEVCSVILQVAYFKATGGKRLFKMAPVHHHFEMCDMAETKVVAGFTILTAVLCALALMTF